MYKRIVEKINENLKYADDYRILVEYISSAGNHLEKKIICVNQRDLDKYKEDPSILMGKGEYNKYLKEAEGCIRQEVLINIRKFLWKE